MNELIIIIFKKIKIIMIKILYNNSCMCIKFFSSINQPDFNKKFFEIIKITLLYQIIFLQLIDNLIHQIQ
jgi:hypothetical protein